MNIRGIFKGTLISFFTALASLLIGAALVYHNLLKEDTASIMLFAFAVLGIFIGAFIAAKNAYSRIILNSLAVSIMFILLIVICSLITNSGFSLHTNTGVLILSAVAAGILGAMFGKN